MEASSNRRGRFGRVRELFAQVFSDQEIISPGRYCAYNAVVGLFAAVFGVLSWVDPRQTTRIDVLLLLTVGAVLLSGVVVALLWPPAVLRLLVVQGALVVVLALWLWADAMKRVLSPEPPVSFKYFPGPILVGVTYGLLQIAAFGPWPAQARRLRMSGFVVGIIFELAMATNLLLRFGRAS